MAANMAGRPVSTIIVRKIYCNISVINGMTLFPNRKIVVKEVVPRRNIPAAISSPAQLALDSGRSACEPRGGSNRERLLAG
ncbi:hypothetical protein [Sphingomonas sp. Root720]|uniref:hypothetical protein n=1 Tax=Sphingomonas sp. Root720 TaxID=1736595 RepID=UPI001F245D25|nr:hypothetical protein [Sphingomonas sp. Root720]